MISDQLPDPRLFSKTKRPQSGNGVVRATISTPYFYPRHETPYLFVGNYEGTGHYLLNDRTITVTSDYYYLLNAGDELEITFRNPNGLHSLLIMLDKQLIERCIQLEHSTPEQLLEGTPIQCITDRPIPAVPQLYDPMIRQLLSRIQVKGSGDPLEREGFFFELAQYLHQKANRSANELQLIPAVRWQTREELYRRVLLGKLYMNDNWHHCLLLDDIAKAACLDKYYFLKIFRSLYATTPHQYLNNIRLEKAVALLKNGSYSIGDICQMVGFESLGSFSQLFKRKYGVAPSFYFKSK